MTLCRPSPSRGYGPGARCFLLPGRASPRFEEARSAAPTLSSPVSPRWHGGPRTLPTCLFLSSRKPLSPVSVPPLGSPCPLLSPPRKVLSTPRGSPSGVPHSPCRSRPGGRRGLALLVAQGPSCPLAGLAPTVGVPAPAAPCSPEGPLRAPRKLARRARHFPLPSRPGGRGGPARFPLVSFYQAGSLWLSLASLRSAVGVRAHAALSSPEGPLRTPGKVQ